MGQENTSHEKEKKSTIINAVKSWLGLFTLVVLVMEGMLVLAMTLTPASDPIFILYPLMMFLLAMALMIAWLIDSKQKRKFNIDRFNAETERIKAQQTVKVDNMEISVDPEKSTTKELETGLNMFTDNNDMINERDINICDNHQTCDGVITGLMMTTFSKDNDLMVMIMIK